MRIDYLYILRIYIEKYKIEKIFSKTIKFLNQIKLFFGI